MSPPNLSKFRKVSTDGKTTTLRHSDGHMLRVAHSNLSSDFQRQLDAMPVHKADGGGSSDDPAEFTPPEDESDEDPAAAPEPAPAEDDSTAPEPDEEPDQNAAPEPEVNTATGTADDPIVVQGDKPEAPTSAPVPNAPDLDLYDAQFYKDHQDGHITPETYGSLFAQKSTLGKIGTLFGMLLSGAGSGLAHQPNMVMEMMNKQIDNDLQAQKATKENTRNYYQLALQHEMQKVEIPLKQAQADLAKAQASKIPSEIQEAQARIKSLQATAEYTATQTSLNRMRISTYHDLGRSLSKAPPASQSAAAPAYNALGNAILSENQANNAQTAANTAPVIAKANLASNSVIDMDKFNKLQDLGTVSDSLGVPGGMRPGQVQQANEEAGHSQQIQNVAKQYNDAFQKLDKLALAGKLNPADVAAQKTLLTQELSKAFVGHYNPQEAEAIANGLFPDAKDWGSAREDKYNSTIMALHQQYDNTPTLGEMNQRAPGLKRDFQEPKSPFPEKYTGPVRISGGVRYGKDKNGKAFKLDK